MGILFKISLLWWKRCWKNVFYGYQVTCRIDIRYRTILSLNLLNKHHIANLTQKRHISYLNINIQYLLFKKKKLILRIIVQDVARKREGRFHFEISYYHLRVFPFLLHILSYVNLISFFLVVTSWVYVEIVTYSAQTHTCDILPLLAYVCAYDRIIS